MERLKKFTIIAVLLCIIVLMFSKEARVQTGNCNSGAQFRRRAYPVFYHNPGLYPNTSQDYDMDLIEKECFLEDFDAYICPSDTPVIGDDFHSDCNPYWTHGETVEKYFEWVIGYRQAELVDNDPPWPEMVNYIADNYNEGTVANLSCGNESGHRWEPDNTIAVLNAYNSGVLLVGPRATFAPAPLEIKDKILYCIYLSGDGFLIGGGGLSPNVAVVCVATNWLNEYNPGDPLHCISDISVDYSNEHSGYAEYGSYTSPLLAGSVQYIADVVASRTSLQGGDFVQKVLDYVISSCDRNDDPESYEHHLQETLHSYGPWSSSWGYGVFSAWKALLYTYGFGVLEAKDSSLDPVDNPPTVFSDHFMLRGDLFVPSEQTFRVSSLASISIDPTAPVPEGPSDLGIYTSLHEIRVAGDMEIETSLNNGVNTTLVIDSGGSCTVKNGGLVTISNGQILRVMEGGELNLELGGELVIENGGKLIILGDFNHAGTLTLVPALIPSAGCEVQLWNTANLYLEADIHIPANVYFHASQYIGSGQSAVITVASADVGGTGEDPNKVEIICEGRLNFWSSSALTPIVLQGEQAGSDIWAGIVLDASDGTGSTFNCVQISDAGVGLDISGSNNVYINGASISDCDSGLKVTGKSGFGVYLTGSEISDCSCGIDFIQSNINVIGSSIHDNTYGIRCETSSPIIRNCDIYANDIGIQTLDSSSIPDLGLTSNPGNNDFHGPNPEYPGLANDIHISAMDPMNDIYAQKNWWGTIETSPIEARIQITDIPPPGAGSVIYQPFLTGAPGGQGASQWPEEDDQDETPKANYLSQNCPNPFNPSTNITFGLKHSSSVSLRIYDTAGRLIKVLVDDYREAGSYEETWNGTDLRGNAVVSGVYFCRLIAGEETISRKMVLLR